MAMRHAGIALLVAAVLAAGCGSSAGSASAGASGAPASGHDRASDGDTASDDLVALVTAGLGCYAGGEHPVTAELVADAEHGTTFGGLPVVWPLGFTGRRAGSEVEVLDPAGNVRATTGRIYWISMAGFDQTKTDVYPAAVECDYPWDFGQCDAIDEPALPSGIRPNDHEESRAAYCGPSSP
jgi:hypothetical protein